MTVSTPEQRATYEHDIQLRDTLIRCLRWRERQMVHFGMNAPPEIVLDIQRIERELSPLDKRIADDRV